VGPKIPCQCAIRDDGQDHAAQQVLLVMALMPVHCLVKGSGCCVCRADKKWGQAYLTRDFFQIMGETMPEHVLLVMAEDGGRPMAGALNLIGSHALFGRNWGCAYDCEIKHLHFEMCYYQVTSTGLCMVCVPHPKCAPVCPCGCGRSSKLHCML